MPSSIGHLKNNACFSYFIRFVIQSFVRCYGIPIQFFKFAEWINKFVLVLIVNKGKSISVINKAEIKFPTTETSRDILLERQFSPFKQDGRQLLLFPYIPHRNSNSFFGYNNRMLPIQGAYKRQKADHTGGGFGNGTAGHIRFICQVIIDSSET